jgi:hypothetical protein
MEDPFVSSPEAPAAARGYYLPAALDTQLFSLNATSPSQAKRALEAHLAETERRLQEASKLGTALVQQQKELTEKLKEVDEQQDDGEIGPDLRRKLVDLEKEYNEVGRESARAFLAPKRLVSGGDGTPAVDLRVSIPLKSARRKITKTPHSHHRIHPSSRARPMPRLRRSVHLPVGNGISHPVVYMISNSRPKFLPHCWHKSVNCKLCLRNEKTR